VLPTEIPLSSLKGRGMQSCPGGKNRPLSKAIILLSM